MRTRPAFVLGIGLLALGFFGWRLADLEGRPMHCDEAVHGVKFGMLLEQGRFEYDPAEYHGPTLHYFTLPWVWMLGARSLAEVTEFDLRLVSVVFGMGLILLVPLVADGLGGRGAGVAAAILVGISPMMAYYGRYYIQESLLVFASFLLLAGGWRFSRRPSLLWAMVAGLGAGLMFATKETCLIVWFAMGAALLATGGWKGVRRIPSPGASVVVFLGSAAVVGILFYTSFLTNPRGIVDAVRSYALYLDRAAGQGHEKPWFYYLEVLSDAGPARDRAAGPEVFLLILALAGAVAALVAGTRSASPLARYLAVYAAVLFCVYSAIPYKTPWLMQGFVHAATLLGGAGAASLLRFLGRPWLAWPGVALLLGGAVWTAGECYRLCFRDPAGSGNPYAYSHTSTDLRRFENNLREAARFHPDGKGMVIKVMSPEYWPLPWRLRDFPNTGYWNGPEGPADPRAPVMIVTPDAEGALERRIRAEEYRKDYGGLRPGVILTAYIRRDLWDAMVEARRERPRPGAGSEP